MSPFPRFVLLDGGVGHILKSKDPKGQLNFLGGALAPETAIREAHRSFVAAGADVLTTATFGVTPGSLRRAGIAEGELEGITRRVARLAVEVAAEENRRRRGKEGREGGRVLVAGCLPPLGDNCYLPYSSSSLDGSAVAAAAVIYERIAAALLEAGVDLFLAETCSGSADAEAAVRGASSAVAASASAAAAAASFPAPSPPPPLWLSFTVDDEVPSRLRGGEELEAAATRALLGPRGDREAGLRIPVSALLLNCSSPRAVSAALPLLRRAVERASLERRRKGGEKGEREEVGLGCFANGFRLTTTSWLRSQGAALPLRPAAAAPTAADEAAAAEEEDGTDSGDFDEGGTISPGAYARHARWWLLKSGYRSSSSCSPSSPSSSFFVLGGCCGVGPGHVRALRSLLDSEEEEEEEEEGSRPL